MLTVADISAEFDNLSELLAKSCQVGEGVQQLSKWCKEFLGIVGDTLPHLGIGALIVPQTGEGSGNPARITVDLTTKLSHAAGVLVSDYWRNPPNTDSAVVITSDLMPENTLFIACPISVKFDRAIGLVWCIVTSQEAELGTAAVRYASTNLAMVIWADKGSRALDYVLRQSVNTGSQTPAAIANDAITACVNVLGCKAGIVWQVSRGTGAPNLNTIAMTGNVGNAAAFDMPLGHGAAGSCASTGKILHIDDLLDVVELNRKEVRIYHHHLVSKCGWRSAVFVPLQITKELIGVMGVYAGRPRAFSGLDKQIATAFAERISTVYELAHRMRQLEDKERRIELEAAAIESGVAAIENVHDAYNSLGIAQAQIGLVRDRFSKEPKSQMYIASKGVSENVDSALRLLQVMRDGANVTHVRFGYHRIAETVKRVIAETANDAKNVNIDVSLFCPEGLRAEYDERQMTRVFKNFLVNSIYFLQTVRRERKIKVTAWQTANDIHISFWDNGPGICQEDLPKVFDYFFTTKGDRGMGFGLAIAQRIVKVNHGGLIRVRSIWGTDAEFTVCLPNTKAMKK